MRGGFSGGTIGLDAPAGDRHGGCGQLEDCRRSLWPQPRPVGRAIVVAQRRAHEDRQSARPRARACEQAPVRRSPDGHWLAPFVMASFNTRIVRRSNALLGHAYGRGFRYAEVMDFGTSLKAPVLATGMTAGLLGRPAGRGSRDPRRPRPGPAQAGRRPEPGGAGEGPVPDGDRVHDDVRGALSTVFAAKADPGYSGTAIMLSQAGPGARARRPAGPGGGAPTPASAIGRGLADRLRAQGFRIRRPGWPGRRARTRVSGIRYAAFPRRSNT